METNPHNTLLEPMSPHKHCLFTLLNLPTPPELHHGRTGHMELQDISLRAGDENKSSSTKRWTCELQFCKMQVMKTYWLHFCLCYFSNPISKLMLLTE